MNSIGTEIIKMKDRSGIRKRLQTREDPKTIQGFRTRINEATQWFLVRRSFSEAEQSDDNSLGDGHAGAHYQG